MIAVLFFVHRQLWLQIKPLPTGQSRLIIRISAPSGFNQAAELQHILTDIQQSVQLKR